jgi:hypothetical protein
MVSPVSLNNGGIVMKTIVSVLIALSVLAGIVGPVAAADDSKTFFEQQDRTRY